MPPTLLPLLIPYCQYYSIIISALTMPVIFFTGILPSIYICFFLFYLMPLPVLAAAPDSVFCYFYRAPSTFFLFILLFFYIINSFHIVPGSLLYYYKYLIIFHTSPLSIVFWVFKNPINVLFSIILFFVLFL